MLEIRRSVEAVTRGAPGGRRRRRAAGAALALAASAAAFAVAVPAAQAGSGDFCSWAPLSPGAYCYGEYHGSFRQVEGWNSDGHGVGSCAGVYNGGVRGQNCVGDRGGYDEVYCSSSCAGLAGAGFVSDDSRYNSVFTGWGNWA